MQISYKMMSNAHVHCPFNYAVFFSYYTLFLTHFTFTLYLFFKASLGAHCIPSFHIK